MTDAPDAAPAIASLLDGAAQSTAPSKRRHHT